MVHNDLCITTKEWILLNVERFIMKFGLICLKKMTMICLHTLEDDVFMRKELLCFCGTSGIDNMEINNKTYKIKGFKCH